MDMDIKKIILEEVNDFDWADESEARLVKGMVICNKHGRRFKIYNVFLDTSRSEGYVEFYVDTTKSGNGLFTKPLYYVMNGLELGSLTICKDNSIRESNDFDWVRDATPIPIGTKITNVNGLPYSLSLGVEPDSVISGWNKGIVRVEEYMDEVVRVTLIGYDDPMYVRHSDLKGYLEGHLGSIVEVELDSRVIGESEFDWTDIDPTILHKPYIGMKFHTKIGLMKDASSGSIFVINDITGGDGYWDTGKVVHYTEGDGQYKVPMKSFKKYMENGDWLTYYDNVNESEFQWVDDIPEESEQVTRENVFLGMRVRISTHSEFYEDGVDGDSNNPIDVTGTVVSHGTNSESNDVEGLYIEVDWDNESSNSYHDRDLITSQ